MQPDRAPTGCTCPFFVVTRFTSLHLYCRSGNLVTRPINCQCPAETHKLVILDPLATCVKLGNGTGGEMPCDDIGSGSGDDSERVTVKYFILEDA